VCTEQASLRCATHVWHVARVPHAASDALATSRVQRPERHTCRASQRSTPQNGERLGEHHRGRLAPLRECFDEGRGREGRPRVSRAPEDRAHPPPRRRHDRQAAQLRQRPRPARGL
ncbi:MAG: hypothetical protein AVDCRST_MAG67-75, partial [uncultured Solirubrobacteraceae bacterium]